MRYAVWLALAAVLVDPKAPFEVASIKQNVSGTPQGAMRFWPGGRFTGSNVTLRTLVETAYHVIPNKGLVTGGPDWIGSARFDIEATAPPGAIRSGAIDREGVDKSKLMLQSLLENRFQLRVRRETKVLSVYELVAGKKGPKLSKPTPRDCAALDAAYCQGFLGGIGRGIDGHTVSMLDLAEFLTVWTDRVVHDKTGIKGTIDVRTTGWSDPNRRSAANDAVQPSNEALDPGGPSLFTVLEEQLGLALKPTKGPVDTVVIERAERPTAD